MFPCLSPVGLFARSTTSKPNHTRANSEGLSSYPTQPGSSGRLERAQDNGWRPPSRVESGSSTGSHGKSVPSKFMNSAIETCNITRVRPTPLLASSVLVPPCLASMPTVVRRREWNLHCRAAILWRLQFQARQGKMTNHIRRTSISTQSWSYINVGGFGWT